MQQNTFLVVDRDGVVIHPRVYWEVIQKLLRMMMIRRCKRKDNCFMTITDSPEQLAKVREEIRRKVNGSCVAEAQNTVRRAHFSNDRGSGWFYELNDKTCSSYAGAERLLPRAA